MDSWPEGNCYLDLLGQVTWIYFEENEHEYFGETGHRIEKLWDQSSALSAWDKKEHRVKYGVTIPGHGQDEHAEVQSVEKKEDVHNEMELREKHRHREKWLRLKD